MPSEKILKIKRKKVSELSEKLKSSCAGVLVSYKGITVEKDTALRKELRESKVDYFVIKNSVLKRASEDCGLFGLSVCLKQTTAIAISENDTVLPAKILYNFSKNNGFFEIKMGFLEKKVINKIQIENLAKLPSKEILVSQVLSGFNAPIVGFVSILSNTIKSLLYVLNAISENKNV
ncbi:MAG: 50S ribosomal protein L10 [Candidatus Paraimprobicoccus trichonymphae]|uniref:Large ribosomal subunit protein uL10 n=1 Tax=Candidatus Paraimprobicoccus trichonymphae TaxID=3033793 RepID=A0AA48I5J8_9FIRM|nr:MAG: 50S ribosomal protein L10 [Candidatus Paraimprobicoccus trichonymphae]